MKQKHLLILIQEEERPAKRTRTSFEKSAISIEPSPRPSSRRSTFSVEKTKKEKDRGSVSPSTQDLVSSMDTDKNDEEMKKNLMQALDKRIKGKSEYKHDKYITINFDILVLLAPLMKVP